jgi:hypothetical protein
MIVSLQMMFQQVLEQLELCPCICSVCQAPPSHPSAKHTAAAAFLLQGLQTCRCCILTRWVCSMADAAAQDDVMRVDLSGDGLDSDDLPELPDSWDQGAAATLLGNGSQGTDDEHVSELRSAALTGGLGGVCVTTYSVTALSTPAQLHYGRTRSHTSSSSSSSSSSRLLWVHVAL